jgi:2-keto-4-pentenoate hydratase/2-oxohepta-3-ene-1,7-dioic acid hydratase in catechol pathway
MKPDSAILLKATSFVIPEFSEDIHHEIEIIKINNGKYIEPKFAHKYYEEISVDFTARDLQTKRKGLGKAKAFDGSAVEILQKSNLVR